MRYVSKKPKIGALRESKTGSGKTYVVPDGKAWVIKADPSSTPAKAFHTQAEATRAAREMIRDTGGEIIVRGRDGRMRSNFTVGRIGFEKISAVEGIHLTGRMRQDFQEFDQKNLSAGKRRRAIMKKYGGKQT